MDNELDILNMMKKLDPSISLKFTDDQLVVYIHIAQTVISIMGNIDDEKLVLATALKALALCALPENSSMTSQKIKDVEIKYYQGQGRSKWETLFDALINGETIDDRSLEYVGI